MLMLSEDDIIARIKRLEPFSASLVDGSVSIAIQDYQPWIATAIHQGHRLRDDLADICALDDNQRRFEEDPFTGEFIDSFPIVLKGEDSRYEYDLNRGIDSCIYEEAWGEQVWSQALTDQQRSHSIDKHQTYYRILHTLVATLEAKFGLCLVYDVHSYNAKRIEEETPVFNLGTAQINKRKWRNEVGQLLNNLATVSLPNIVTTVAENRVFKGMGFQSAFLRSHFESTVTFPIEIKKVYMDEAGGDGYPLVIAEMKQELKRVLSEHAAYTLQRRTKRTNVKRSDVLASAMPPEVLKLDKMLYQFARGVNTLNYINPINLKSEKRRFMAKPHSYQPKFQYRQLDIDPYAFRENLYRLPVEMIQDADLLAMYRKVIDQLAVRIDLLTSIGTDDFLYNSLRYYGQPSEKDIRNAEFILHCYSEPESEAANLTYKDAMGIFTEAAKKYGFQCRVVATDKLVAKALVSGKTLKVNKKLSFRPSEVQSLVAHELGVHLLTSANAEKQPLRIFQLGLPGNTHTQEGLAILSEFLSGHFSVNRLRVLALRVIAVDMMIKGASFGETYHQLMDKYGIDRELAFTITTRVHRGGGFTKDYLYLKGLRDAYELYQSEKLDALFIGKTGFEHKAIIEELIERNILQLPHYIPVEFQQKPVNDPVMDFLFRSIQ